MSFAPTVPTQLLSSAQRPIPLKARADLTIERIQYQGANSWVIKDPVGLHYYRFQPEQYKILNLLDGERSLEQIRDEFHREFPTVRLTLEEVQNLVTDLHRTGLVYSNRPGQGTAMIKQRREKLRQKIKAGIRNILYIRLPGWDPEATLRAIYPIFRWMFTPFGVFVAIALFLAATTLLTVQFQEFHRRLPGFQQFFAGPNLAFMWIVLGGAKIIHEFGHGLTCKHFRGECHEMGMMLLVLSPCLYCDVSDSWMLKNKWARIMIGAAGMYIESVLSSLAIFGWWFSQPGLFHNLCLNLFFVSTISTVIFNANPLMRYDGYYMMADLLEIPNLRPKADRLLRETFAWWCLGIESRPDPFMPQTGKHWFILFAVAAWIYRWVVLFAILLFFYTFLKPYELQSIGIAIATLSIVSLVGSMVWNIYRVISAPRLQPMSYTKITVSLVVLTLLVAGALSIPLPLHAEAGLIIEPYRVQNVFSQTAGRLEEVFVVPGQRVKPGDILARLSNFDKEQQYRQLKIDEAVQEQELKTVRALNDATRIQLAEEKLTSIREQVADYQMQLERLIIYAPIDGFVVEPQRVPEPKHDANRHQLGKWFGSPLEPRNLGCFLEPRTHLCSIAPNERFQAIMLVDQRDRNELSTEREVKIKLDHFPEKMYRAKVVEISEREVLFAPQALSNKYGGELPTQTDAEGRERLQAGSAYQATLLLDEEAALLRSGMRGRAKFLISNRTSGDWLWLWIRHTFHFRL
jgi:putative peptide zinc metalloprotease protein